MLDIPSDEILIDKEVDSASGYKREAYKITYSRFFVLKRGSPYPAYASWKDAKSSLAAEGYRLPTAAEMKIFYASNRNAIDMSYNMYMESACELTDTVLVRPKGQKKDRYKRVNGRKYWLRTVVEGGRNVGELWVPESDWSRISEWSIFGIPSKVEESDRRWRFYFTPGSDKAVIVVKASFINQRFSSLEFYAVDARNAHGVFRVIQGSLPAYEKLAGR